MKCPHCGAEFTTPKKRPQLTPDCIGSGEVICRIPGIGGEWTIRQTIAEEWQETYPAVDILATLREIRTWVNANPTSRKVNVHRFIVNWLKREQDRG